MRMNTTQRKSISSKTLAIIDFDLSIDCLKYFLWLFSTNKHNHSFPDLFIRSFMISNY